MDVVIEGVPYGDNPVKMAWDNTAEVQRYLAAYRGQKLSFNIKVVSELSEKMRLYRYLHKAVLPVLMEEFTKAGFELLDIVKTDKILKSVIARDYIVNEKTGKVIETTEDKRDMNKARLLKYIVDALHLLESQYGRTVMSGDDYKEMMRVQKEKEEEQ